LKRRTETTCPLLIAAGFAGPIFGDANG